MKILLSIHDTTNGGGTERVVINLANALCELGHEVEILSLYQHHQSPAYALNPAVRLRFLHHFDEPQTKRRFAHARNAISRRVMSWGLKKGGYDFIIASDTVYFPYFKNKKTTHIKLMHASFDFAPRTKRNKLFDTLVILSSKELPLWQAHHKSVRVIPNFLPHIPQKCANPAQKVVLSVGRMDRGEQKGFSRLLDIWQILSRDEDFESEFKQWHLIIVGDGVLKPELERKVREFALTNVRLKPFTKDIESEYLSASIYAMSSHWEGFGMVLAEASACALPCVSFDIKTGPSDIIESEKSGFLVADGDLAGFAKVLKILMKDENLRAEFGCNAKKIVGEKFSKKAVLKLWQGLFEEVARERI